MLQHDDDTHHFQVTCLSLFDQQFGAEEVNNAVIKLKKRKKFFYSSADSSSETQGQIVPFWLLIGARKLQKFSGTNQKPERRRPFGTGLVRHCPQGLFSPFFTFLRAIFFCPFRLSLAPTICPWVSEDGAD